MTWKTVFAKEFELTVQIAERLAKHLEFSPTEDHLELQRHLEQYISLWSEKAALHALRRMEAEEKTASK